MVWLLICRHITTTHPCAQMEYKNLGPFHIIQWVNQVTFRPERTPHTIQDSCCLPWFTPQILPSSNVHSSNPSILFEFREDNLPTATHGVVNKGRVRGRWDLWLLPALPIASLPISEAAWESAIHLQNLPNAVRAFDQQYLHKLVVSLGRRP